MCEPISTRGPVFGLRPITLPTPSISGTSPASFIRPASQWRPGMTMEMLVADLSEKLTQVPGYAAVTLSLKRTGVPSSSTVTLSRKTPKLL